VIIKNMRKLNGDSKVVAFFSVEWPGKMEINDCKLVAGQHGLFAGMPSREYIDKQTNQKKYQSIVYLEQDLLNRVSQAAEAEYNKGNEPKQAPTDDIPF
jgi:DNA-binding cell septation regulator SpoVG